MLGDGTLRRQDNRLNALFEVNHSYAFKDYVDWKCEQMKEYVITSPKSRKGKGMRVAYRFTTRSLPIFTDYYKWFYKNGRKQIPLNLELDPQILAVWFMDDGSKSRSAYYLNTQQFSLCEQKILQMKLEKDMGIKSTLNRDKKYLRLRISTESAKYMTLIVEKYILPCFRYKLTYDPVTTDPKGKILTLGQDNTPTPITKNSMIWF